MPIDPEIQAELDMELRMQRARTDLDKMLGVLGSREYVPASEVVDGLLDVRNALANSALPQRAQR
jgi:hypothetical protein